MPNPQPFDADEKEYIIQVSEMFCDAIKFNKIPIPYAAPALMSCTAAYLVLSEETDEELCAKFLDCLTQSRQQLKEMKKSNLN